MKELIKVILMMGIALSAQLVVADPADGKTLFERHCNACHTPDIEYAGYFQPLATRGEQYADIVGRGLPADYVRQVVRNGLNVMTPFSPAELTNAELEAIARYLAASVKQ